MKKSSNYNPNFSDSAIYQIVVAGEVRSEWADRLRGMQIIKETNVTNDSITVLTGQINDQPALASVLNTLVDMHMVILNVKALVNNAN